MSEPIQEELDFEVPSEESEPEEEYDSILQDETDEVVDAEIDNDPAVEEEYDPAVEGTEGLVE